MNSKIPTETEELDPVMKVRKIFVKVHSQQLYQCFVLMI